MKGPSLPESVARLREEYLRDLPRRASELAEALRAFGQQPGDAVARSRALRIAHTICGTAGSYGMAAVGDAAWQVERSLHDAEPPPNVEELVAGFNDAIEQAQQGTEAEIEPPTELMPLRSGPRLLFVGSDRALLSRLADVARAQLWAVDAALGATEALQAAAAARPDAALIELGDGGASEAAALVGRLRALHPEAPMPVAVAAPSAALPDVVQAARGGVSLFLDAAAEAPQLSALLELLFAERRAQAANVRVVVIDDDEAARERMLAALTARGLEPAGIGASATLLEALDERRPDALVIAPRAGGARGADLCRAVRAVPRFRELPVVLLRDPRAPEVRERLEAIEAGADDLLAGEGQDDELAARIQRLVVRARVVRERADTDALTGLLLRRPFLDRLAARLAEARRRRFPITLCLLDLDHFKQVNDAVGHLSGDRLLAAFGRVLLATSRLEDLRCRWGGDEFALAFPHQGPDAARLALARVEPRARTITMTGAPGSGVQFSAGMATFPGDGLDAAELLRVADQRLYRAKAMGRGRAITG